MASNMLIGNRKLLESAKKRKSGGGDEITSKKRRMSENDKNFKISRINFNDSDDDENLIDCLLEEQVCHKCEENISKVEEPVKCAGQCFRVFHRSCVAQHIRLGRFTCFVCLLGGKWCFLCKTKIEKNSGFETCEIKDCRNCFHSSCIENLNEKNSSSKFVCAHHYCLTCTVEDRNPTRGKFLACIKCPSAFHKADRCIPAGTVLMNYRWIMCTNHKTTESSPKKTNVNFCFVCGLGGTLLCCESCPCAVHLECYGLKSAPEGSFICSTCEKGRKPMYGDIVWAKFGSHRWWPAEIVHPLKVPTNLDKYVGDPGVFIVHFFGSKDYGPVTQRNVYAFQDDDVNDEKSAKQCKNTKDKKFIQAIIEARQALKDHHYIQLRSPPVYIRIHTNRYSPDVSKAIYRPDLSNMTCSCSKQDDSACGDESCENRSTFTECDPEDCPGGPLCRNQRFIKRQHVPTIKFLTLDRGYGLRTLVSVKKGEFVIEYVGEVITRDECYRRLDKNRDKPDRAFYFLQLTSDRIIDAGPMGNDARFINHSCEANCRTERWVVRGEYRIGLFADKDINAGEELTFHYNLDSLNGDYQTPCKCNSASCTGFIGRIQKKNGNSVKPKKA